MKILYYVFNGRNSYSGINKKILSQVNALKKLGYDTDLLYSDFLEDENQAVFVNDKPIFFYGKGIKAKIRKRIDYSFIVQQVKNHNIDIIYIRHDMNASLFLINALKTIRKINLSIKILVEIPTYPYDKEFKYARWPDKVKLLLDKCYRKRYAKSIDSFVSFTSYPTIFGQRNIEISNGVDFDSIPCIKRPLNKIKNNGVFNMISVSEVHYWHGIDRLIEGMALYYKNKGNNPDLLFHLVGRGYGAEYNKLVNLVKERKLENRVVFYGNRNGDELNDVFELSDLGIASLGRHRSGIDKIKTLKNREYAARGIPFVYSETDEDFENKEYIIKVPADETPIDIKLLITFYNNLNLTHNNIRSSIEGKLDWMIQMKKVMDSILSK
ncbi:MAG: glycosyltransferase [Bacteroidales bacterium]